MAITLSDFKELPKHKGYLVRDLGDNRTGYGQWYELMREDGWGFGAMPEEAVEDVVTADEANPRPATGGHLSDFVPQADPDAYHPEVVETDAPTPASTTRRRPKASASPTSV